MKTATFANFQVGMVDDPSVEDEGGFEYASGMDIFSEPGICKACLAMAEVSFGASATPTDVPRWADEIGGSTNYMYVAAGAKVLESTDGITFNLFLTNGNGGNLGLRIFDGYVYYGAASQLGRAPLGNAAAKNDSYAAIESDGEYHPMEPQAGTLKIGCGRYIASVAEGGTVTTQALKLPTGYRAKSLADHLTRLVVGTKVGAATGGTLFADASVFDWNGIVLASGSALPMTRYPLKMRGMHALLSHAGQIYGVPDDLVNLHLFDGITFQPFRKIYTDAVAGAGEGNPGAFCGHQDTILWGGSMPVGAGVWQARNGAICQAYVPSTLTPGGTGTYNIGFIRSAFNGVVFMGYFSSGDTSYHIQKTGTNRQNNAVMRTLWHRLKTDKLKRHVGVKLNLKPMAANTAVTVSYRTERGAAFTAAPYTITSANQDKPVIFTVHPRTREIQYKYVYTTSTSNTPELMSYDPIFEVLNTMR